MQHIHVHCRECVLSFIIVEDDDRMWRLATLMNDKEW